MCALLRYMSLKTELYIFCGYHFGLLFPVDLNVFRSILKSFFHFRLDLKRAQRSVVAPPPPIHPWGGGLLWALPPVLDTSDSFLWGFGSDGFCWMQGALLGFMGFCSSAFPHLGTPGHAGDSVLQAMLDSHFLNNL